MKNSVVMMKYLVPVAGALLLLCAALLLPRLAGADASADAAPASSAVAAPSGGYRTCYLERSFVAYGTPRLESRRRCVFDE